MTEDIKLTYKSVPQDPTSFFFQYIFKDCNRYSQDDVSFISLRAIQEKEIPHYVVQ